MEDKRMAWAWILLVEPGEPGPEAGDPRGQRVSQLHWTGKKAHPGFQKWDLEGETE